MKPLRPLCLAALLLACACNSARQQPDADYDTRIAEPRYRGAGPFVLYDESHLEVHKATGTYEPFVSLLRNDGYIVRVNKQPLDRTALATAKALVIVNARGTNEAGDSSAFTTSEIRIVKDWVASGGGLLLVVDHFPFAAAASSLAEAFGARVGLGMTEDSLHYDTVSGDESQLVFSRANKLLRDHVITRGLNDIMTFTGTSIQPPANAAVLLALSPDAFDLLPSARVVRDGNSTRVVVTYDSVVPAGGRAQAIAIEYGRGRVVVVAEAASLSAQIDGRDGHKFGMNVVGIDNRQFGLNIMAWLVQ